MNSSDFHQRAATALGDPVLQTALGRLEAGFSAGRRDAVLRLENFEALRDRAVEICDHTLDNLDHYLEQFETALTARGGVVHWCADAQAARQVALSLLQQADVRRVVKSKSMIAEEIDLNPYLEAAGIEVVETDLGENIIQLAGEPPSHIIAPALHKTRAQVDDLFRAAHGSNRNDEEVRSARELVDEARRVTREKFLTADAGITGANFLIAETGSIVLVTNEGNADLGHCLPPLHIAITSIDKVIPGLDDAAVLLRLLARSATGQDISTYTSFVTGADNPDAFHLILLDNGRSEMLGGKFREMLRCVKCGACLNHCPVYAAVGGHAYGSVYPGPMGAVLMPLIAEKGGLAAHADLPQASSFCGRCEDVCPVRIPLPDLMRQWREDAFEQKITKPAERYLIAIWSWLAAHPRLYRLAVRSGLIAARLFGRLSGQTGQFGDLSILGKFGSGWTKGRDFPAPAKRSFMDQWHSKQND